MPDGFQRQLYAMTETWCGFKYSLVGNVRGMGKVEGWSPPPPSLDPSQTDSTETVTIPEGSLSLVEEEEDAEGKRPTNIPMKSILEGLILWGSDVGSDETEEAISFIFRKETW
jgi:hypothetical protein